MFFPGFGTLLNAIVMIITGSLGVFLGKKLPNMKDLQILKYLLNIILNGSKLLVLYY